MVPSLNIIVATTGGGFEIGEIDDLLIAALVDMKKPLPANPAGLARLQAAVGSVAQAPAPKPVAPLPGTAKAISGKTFVFEPNPVGMENVRFEFDDSATAIMDITLTGRPGPLRWPVGLDSVYRMSTADYDAPQGVRGYWADAQTFVFEYAGITNNDHYTFRVRFEGERVVVEGQETAHELGVRFEGRMQNP